VAATRNLVDGDSGLPDRRELALAKPRHFPMGMTKRIVTWLGPGLMAAFFCATAAAENRYLFIVETSKAMRRSLDAARLCVESTLARGISGQLRPGDTFGVWTFDSELHTGVFPMQRWSPEARLNLVEATSAFLRQQRGKGKARLSEVLPPLFNVIENSDTITVLILSQGSQPMSGTPFDDTINQIYAEHRDELKNANIPFVTVLQARGGRIVKCTIDSAANAVNISALPPLPETEKTNAPVPPPAEPRQPTHSENPSPAITVTNASAITNAPLVVDYSATAPIPTKGAFKPETGRATKAKSKPDSEPTNAPISEATQPFAEPVVMNEPEPAPVLTNEPVTTTPEVAFPMETNFAPMEAASSPPGESSATAPTLPVPTAVVAPSGESSVGRTVLLAAVVLVVLAGGIFFLRRPRARESGTGSLITRSFDQRRK
jgi:hypothetical protein